MKSKYIFGVIIIAVFLGIMGYLFTQTNISYEEDFRIVKTSNKTMKATGSWVKEKKYGYVIDKDKKQFSFYIVDHLGNEMQVLYDGTIPNNFESATSVVVTGKYSNGSFHADDILTKCPSKYEETFEASSKS